MKRDKKIEIEQIKIFKKKEMKFLEKNKLTMHI